MSKAFEGHMDRAVARMDMMQDFGLQLGMLNTMNQMQMQPFGGGCGQGPMNCGGNQLVRLQAPQQNCGGSCSPEITGKLDVLVKGQNEISTKIDKMDDKLTTVCTEASGFFSKATPVIDAIYNQLVHVGVLGGPATQQQPQQQLPAVPPAGIPGWMQQQPQQQQPPQQPLQQPQQWVHPGLSPANIYSVWVPNLQNAASKQELADLSAALDHYLTQQQWPQNMQAKTQQIIQNVNGRQGFELNTMQRVNDFKAAVDAARIK